MIANHALYFADLAAGGGVLCEHDAVVFDEAHRLEETADDGLCCGAGGAYSVREPELSGQIRERKVAALRAAHRDATTPLVVVSANPGCAMHLQAAGLTVRHPAELLADALLEPPADSVETTDA